MRYILRTIIGQLDVGRARTVGCGVVRRRMGLAERVLERVLEAAIVALPSATPIRIVLAS